MATPSVPYIGSRIVLISKSEIRRALVRAARLLSPAATACRSRSAQREVSPPPLCRYEGTLGSVDTAASTVKLHQVRSFGTEDRKTEGVIPASSQAVEAAGFLLATMLSTPRCRRGFHGCLLRGGTGNRRAGALIAALLGNRSLRRALRKAAERFRCVAVDEVAEEDLLSPRDTGLHARSVRASLGQVDAFVSHSWGDDGTCKMAALRYWASEFEAAHGRRPTVWLDKGSIDQTSVAADLAGLPLYLLGCRSLLVLVGNTYGSRLWCVMEVFAWLQMGGRREDIQIVRLGSRCSLADDLSRFSLESSRCGLAADRERLLGAIEAAFGDFQPFNRCIRDTFAADDRGEARVCIGASEGEKT